MDESTPLTWEWLIYQFIILGYIIYRSSDFVKNLRDSNWKLFPYYYKRECYATDEDEDLDDEDEEDDDEGEEDDDEGEED